jgi:TetR/AcrR family transcriptional regulator, cholesterol catabolism regulator
VTNIPSVEAGRDFGAPRKRPSARRSKPMDSEARWEEILDAAAKVFLQNGYEASSLQEIATNVGILKGSIYYYIKTKEDLLFEIIRRSQEDYTKTREEDAATAAASAPVRLAAFITRWTTLSPKQRDWGEVAEGSFTRLSPARLKVVIERRDDFSDYVKQIITQGIAEGAFDPSVDVSLATISVFELLRSTRQWHHPRGRLSKAAVAEWYSVFIVRGLGGPSWEPAKGR